MLTFVSSSSKMTTDNYVYMDLDDDINDIICYKKDPTKDDRKIALPESMLADTVQWFHQVMGHLVAEGCVIR